MKSAKRRPEGARQHATAGPYSPVLEVDAGKLIVISGQVAVDADGRTVGDDIEAQTRATLDNCRAQLEIASAGFEDVFKVNVWLTDLALWERFNAVYSTLMPEPLPVRTAVQCGLLGDYVVEIEMWAAKPR